MTRPKEPKRTWRPCDVTAGSRLATYTLVFFSAPCGRAMATCAAPNDASDGQPARFTLTRARAHASRRAGGRVGARVGAHTLSTLFSILVPLRPWMAWSASFAVRKRTNPYPRLFRVPFSLIIRALSTVPNLAKTCRAHSPVMPRQQYDSARQRERERTRARQGRAHQEDKRNDMATTEQRQSKDRAKTEQRDGKRRKEEERDHAGRSVLQAATLPIALPPSFAMSPSSPCRPLRHIRSAALFALPPSSPCLPLRRRTCASWSSVTELGM